MITYNCSFYNAVIHTKIQTICCARSTQNRLCRTHTIGRDSLLQTVCKTTAGNRRELPSLLNHTGNRIRKIGASDTVHDHAAHRKFSIIWLAPCLTLDDGS